MKIGRTQNTEITIEINDPPPHQTRGTLSECSGQTFPNRSSSGAPFIVCDIILTFYHRLIINYILYHGLYM